MRQQMGEQTEYVISAGLKLDGDLNRFEYPHFGFVMTAHWQYTEHGTFPFPGAIAEQPAQIMETFATMDQLHFERERASQIESQRKARKKNG